MGVDYIMQCNPSSRLLADMHRLKSPRSLTTVFKFNVVGEKRGRRMLKDTCRRQHQLNGVW